MNKIQFIKGMTYRDVSLTNLLTHSNFDATTDWNTTGQTFSVASNEATFLANSAWGVVWQPIAITSGRKYYISMWQKSTTTMRFSLSDNIDNAITLYNGGSNSYEFLSGVYTATRSISNAYFYPFVDSRSGGWDNAYGKYCVAIDLTAAFGAGLEPGKGAMDWLMTQFTNYWFSGTVTAKCHW